jgi:hypothetical protein
MNDDHWFAWDVNEMVRTIGRKRRCVIYRCWVECGESEKTVYIFVILRLGSRKDETCMRAQLSAIVRGDTRKLKKRTHRGVRIMRWVFCLRNKVHVFVRGIMGDFP